MSESYRWRGSRENLLRHGSRSPVTLLVLPALFEEANRMRRFTVCVMRSLAPMGIGTILPDLPGTGESETALRETEFSDWEEAVGTLAGGVQGSIALRGGALLDRPMTNRWRIAPETGERLLRDMVRATAFSTGSSVVELDRQARATPTRLAGNLLSPSMFSALHEAEPTGGAHVTTVTGPKLWRAAEPTEDADFARRIAEDIAAWVQTCAIS